MTPRTPMVADSIADLPAVSGRIRHHVGWEFDCPDCLDCHSPAQGHLGGGRWYCGNCHKPVRETASIVDLIAQDEATVRPQMLGRAA